MPIRRHTTVPLDKEERSHSRPLQLLRPSVHSPIELRYNKINYRIYVPLLTMRAASCSSNLTHRALRYMMSKNGSTTTYSDPPVDQGLRQGTSATLIHSSQMVVGGFNLHDTPPHFSINCVCYSDLQKGSHLLLLMMMTMSKCPTQNTYCC